MSDAIKAELAEIEARRVKRKEERAARLEAKRPEDELVEARRLDAVEAALVDAEAKHGELGRGVLVVHARHADGRIAGSVIVKRPQPEFYKRASARIGAANAANKPDAAAQEGDKVIAHCRVWPEMGQVEALAVEVPGLSTLLFDAIAKLAGLLAQEVEGKA